MFKIPPLQKPNPSIDYNKNLHNWLRLQYEHVTQYLWKSVVRERLAKYMKYNTKNDFFHRLAYWSDRLADFDEKWFTARVITQGCSFYDCHRNAATRSPFPFKHILNFVSALLASPFERCKCPDPYFCLSMSTSQSGTHFTPTTLNGRSLAIWSQYCSLICCSSI